MKDELTSRQASFCAAVFCDDPRLCRLLEIELSLCGVTVVSEAEDYSLCLVDLDEHPEAVMPRERCRYLCWSRAIDIHPPVGNIPAVCLHRPFSLQDLEDGIRRLLSDEPVIAENPARVIRPPVVKRREAGSNDAATEEKFDISPLPHGGVSVAGREIPLTPREQALFDCLWENRGTVVSKERLWAVLCAAEGEDIPRTNTTEVYVCFLRRKIEKPSARRLITTVRGQGYRLDI